MGYKKILLADDDADDKMIIKDAIRFVSNEDIMYFAENGEETLEVLNENYEEGELPCLVVLDLNMPKMNGTETLRHIKSDVRFKDIPVIIYSTSINPLEKEKCLLLGAHSYITKPISLKESLATAKQFFDFCLSQTVVE
jgi:CheY-like chemotaxis protein